MKKDVNGVRLPTILAFIGGVICVILVVVTLHLEKPYMLKAHMVKEYYKTVKVDSLMAMGSVAYILYSIRGKNLNDTLEIIALIFITLSIVLIGEHAFFFLKAIYYFNSFQNW